MKALIVEDDFTCRAWLCILVKKHGFSVVAEATNGEEAVATVGRIKPDIVLLDVSMPLQTGPKALPAILAAHPAARVVMVTRLPIKAPCWNDSRKVRSATSEKIPRLKESVDY